MPLVRKVDPKWAPAEKPDLQVGETIAITDPSILLKGGAVVLVDEETGEDKARLEVIQCPVCNFETKDLDEFQEHLSKHKKVKSQEKKVYKCPKCDFEADKPIILASHVRRDHA